MAGDPRSLGTLASDTAGGGSDTSVLTTTADHAAGDPIIVAVTTANTRTSSTMTDSAGNSYARAATMNQASVRFNIFVSSGATALASGGTITLTTTGASAGEVNMSAVDVNGYSSTEDADGTGSGASGEPSVSITTVANRGIVFAGVGQASALAGSYTEDAEWTSLTGVSGTGFQMAFAYKTRTVAGADSWDPETGLSVGWAAAAESLAALNLHSLSMMGAGPS